MPPAHLPQRRSVRLPEYDYGAQGCYFITCCTHQRAEIFGEISNGVMCLNNIGALVWEEWEESLTLRPQLISEAFSVMPNHWHALIGINRAVHDTFNASRIEEFGKPTGDTIAGILRGFKSAITASVLKAGWEGKFWQRGFHDHVVRNQEEFYKIKNYINNNPKYWGRDCFHP